MNSNREFSEIEKNDTHTQSPYFQTLRLQKNQSCSEHSHYQLRHYSKLTII